MIYNANAEEKIYNLIENASEQSLSEGTVMLKQALIVLNQEFGKSHSGDLPNQDVERFDIRRKTYEKIIKTYDKLVNNFMNANYEILSKEKSRLEFELSETEKVENGFEGYVEILRDENEKLKEKADGLEETIEQLNSEITQLEEAQEAFKNI